jgi:hypothetical protein
MRDRPIPLPPGFTPPHNSRFRRVNGTPYVPDVVERVRVLVEGTGLPLTEIAARTGVGATTVHGWIHRRGWRRPAAASRSTRAVGLGRAGFTRRLGHALARVEALAARELETLAREALTREALARGTDPNEADRARALVEAVRLARRRPRRAARPRQAEGRRDGA